MEHVCDWLSNFKLDAFLHAHVAAVLAALPDEVREALIADPAFRLSDYEGIRGEAFLVPFASPAVGKPARSVVLKRTLKTRSAEFVRYVIAHELAHAHLNNRGRFPDEDPETAADALATDWGFPKPLAIQR